MWDNNKQKNEKVFTFLMIVSGCTILWLGIGFTFLATSSLYFLASTLVGVGVWLLSGVFIFNKTK